MNAIISKGDKTAHVQLPVERKQLAGALSYLGANHTSDYDFKYNEENKDGLKVSLECFGVVENAIAKALPVGFRFHTLNESLTLMGNLPYQNRREVENTIKVDGLESYEQFNKMLVDAYELQFLFHSDGWFLLHCIVTLLNNGKLKPPTEGQKKALTTIILPNS